MVEADGGDVLTGTFDVRDDSRLREFFDAVETRFERVDILVNNAGGGFQSPLLEVSAGGEQALVAENFTTVTQCVRVRLPEV